jgi:D-alanyl-lipoteichoic acid acyltransferase DltB (MBOAT superfamily)
MTALAALTGGNASLPLGLAVAAAFAAIVSLFPALRRGPPLSVLSTLGAAAFFGRAFAGFAIVNVAAYAIARSLGRQTDPVIRWRRASFALVGVVAVFTAGRLLHWDHWTVRAPLPVVLFNLDMWLALRLVTLFWEVGSGATQAPSASEFAGWVCLPLTLVGPLLRYSQYRTPAVMARSLWVSPRWWLDLTVAAAKLGAGAMLFPAAQLELAARWPSSHHLVAGTAALVTGPIGFYLTFAGLYGLMETLGRPAGFALPESFNAPIGRENISAFWASWNLTATAVFRDYLFYNRWGSNHYNVYFNTLLLFTLVGLWHGANAYWISWGLLHGLLFCAFMMWRRYRAGIGHLPLQGTWAARTAARVFTYVSVCACWYLPSKILQKLGSL